MTRANNTSNRTQKRRIIALIVVVACVIIAWTIIVSATQQAGFDRYRASNAATSETVTIIAEDGAHRIPKSEYDAANAEYAKTQSTYTANHN